MRVAIRADGAHDIGLGHLYRSAIVAEALVGCGHDVTTVTRTPEHAAQVTPDGVAVAEIPSTSDEAIAVANWIVENNIDAVVTDSYDINTSYQRTLGSTDAKLTVMLDDARFPIAADILVNGNLYAPELEYEWEGEEPTWCLGTDYLLLREPFRTYAEKVQPFPDTVEDIVVTMGGVDLENRTPTAMQALDRFDVPVTVIVGPGFTTEDEIRATAAELDGEITIREDPEDLPQVFLNADLAVCTLGTTTYELLATQTPIVGIPDNDTPIPEALDARAAAIVLSTYPDIEDIASGVRAVFESSDLRRMLWRSGGELVSGAGPANVTRAVETSVEH